MTQASKPPASRPPRSTSRRRATFRQRMRACRLRPIVLWVPDIGDPAFADTCRQQAQAIAAGDPAENELMGFVDQLYEWSEG